jgi:hypothetical protein
MIDRETGLLSLAMKTERRSQARGTALAAAQRPVVDPVDHQLSLLEVPMAIHYNERTRR